MANGSSDTVAAALTCLFLELAVNKAKTDILKTELDKYFNDIPGQEADPVSLSKLPYLDAVINEAFRLHPPVPSGVQRVTPPAGLQIGDTFIPGNTIVRVPVWTVNRGMTALL